MKKKKYLLLCLSLHLFFNLFVYAQAQSNPPVDVSINEPQKTAPIPNTVTNALLFLDQLSLVKKAEFFGIYSRAAYEAPTAQQLAQYPFLNDSQAFSTADQSIRFLLIEKDQELLISFRGSDNSANWTSNFNFFAIPIENEDFHLHKGFYESFLAIKKQLITQLLPHKSKKIQLTGHSLGGALAQISAYFLTKEGFDIKAVYTFGAPISGNHIWQKSYHQRLYAQTYTWELFTDPVPLLGGVDESLEPHTLPVGQIKYIHCPCQSEKCVIAEERAKNRIDLAEFQRQLQSFLYFKGANLLLSQGETKEFATEENQVLLKQAMLKGMAEMAGIELCQNPLSFDWIMRSFDTNELMKLSKYIETKAELDIFELLRKMDALHGVENYIRVLKQLSP